MDAALLETYLGEQRWFAGKGRPAQVSDTTTLGWLQRTDPEVWIELVTVSYADGQRPTSEVYQLALVAYAEPVEHLAHSLVGASSRDPGDGTDDTDGAPRTTYVYDALHDKSVTGLWLRGMDGEQRHETLAFHRDPSAGDIPLEEASIVIGAEQSNTSLVFGDAAILKVFRRVSPGLNPDIEIHSALAAAGSTHIAPPLGWLEGHWPDPASGREQTGSLAMAQTFLANSSEGWDLAKTSVRDLYAEADLHADLVGGDFAGEAHRLGIATAEVHRDLAATLPTGVLGPEEIAQVAAGMRERLEHAVAVVAELASYVEALGRTYDGLAAVREPVPVQRVHGDYHLGQVLRTVEGWRLLDFEGEPARPLEERRRLDSPLRDVAGMLRSFDYAARHLLVYQTPTPQREYRAAEWAERNRGAFCDGYAEASGRDPRADDVLLRALETDKAVYEAVYEARNRPSWLPIPMSAIARLADAGADRGRS
jgi:maltokinase